MGSRVTEIAVTGVDPVPTSDMDGHIAGCVSAVRAGEETPGPRSGGCARTPGGSAETPLTGKAAVDFTVEPKVAYTASITLQNTPTLRYEASMIQVTYRPPAPF